MPPEQLQSTRPAPPAINRPSEGDPKPGFVRLYAPAGISHTSYNGEMYAVENGIVEVPYGAAQTLIYAGGYSATPFPTAA